MMDVAYICVVAVIHHPSVLTITSGTYMTITSSTRKAPVAMSAKARSAAHSLAVSYLAFMQAPDAMRATRRDDPARERAVRSVRFWASCLIEDQETAGVQMHSMDLLQSYIDAADQELGDGPLKRAA